MGRNPRGGGMVSGGASLGGEVRILGRAAVAVLRKEKNVVVVDGGCEDGLVGRHRGKGKLLGGDVVSSGAKGKRVVSGAEEEKEHRLGVDREVYGVMEGFGGGPLLAGNKGEVVPGDGIGRWKAAVIGGKTIGLKEGAKGVAGLALVNLGGETVQPCLAGGGGASEMKKIMEGGEVSNFGGDGLAEAQPAMGDLPVSSFTGVGSFVGAIGGGCWRRAGGGGD